MLNRRIMAIYKTTAHSIAAFVTPFTSDEMFDFILNHEPRTDLLHVIVFHPFASLALC
jgi:hypothetical protein